MSMKPTVELRVLKTTRLKFPKFFPLWVNLVDVAFIQQKWIDEFDGRIEEWRDIIELTFL